MSGIRRTETTHSQAGRHSLDFLHVLCGVLVGHVGGTDVKLEVGPVVLKVVIVGQLCGTESKRTIL